MITARYGFTSVGPVIAPQLYLGIWQGECDSASDHFPKADLM